MNLYNYDKNTKEYLSTTLASADPMETKIKGEFVPLVPAYSTLMEPPKTDKNEVAIFNGEAWEIKKDFRVSHKICDENFNIKDITEIGEIEENYLVSADIAELIKENPNNFKIQNNEIVQKTETEIEEEKTKERQIEFEKDFFLTSLGYIRRKVSMATGETKDFLCDLLPAITTGITLGQEIPIITYKEPDFTKEFTLEYLESLQEIKIATQQFCTECALQISADFMGQPLVLSE